MTKDNAYMCADAVVALSKILEEKEIIIISVDKVHQNEFSCIENYICPVEISITVKVERATVSGLLEIPY